MGADHFHQARARGLGHVKEVRSDALQDLAVVVCDVVGHLALIQIAHAQGEGIRERPRYNVLRLPVHLPEANAGLSTPPDRRERRVAAVASVDKG